MTNSRPDRVVTQPAQNSALSLLASPRWPFVLAAVAIVLAAPSIWMGLQADDYFVRTGALAYPGLPGCGTSHLDCFSLADGRVEHNTARIAANLLPWWTPTNVNLRFFRPLSVFTHYVDFRFLGQSYWLMHLHSLLWYGLLCAVVALLYSRILPVPWVAGLAALLYTIDDAHGIPAGWLANRNALMTTFFGVLVLVGHDANRRAKSPWGMPLAAVSLILGLASGEATISVGAYLFAYLLFVDKAPYRSRVLSLVPYAVIAAAYMAFYHLWEYGSPDSGLYLDPFSYPGKFLLAVAMHVPIMLHAQLGLVPANIYPLLSPAGHAILSLAGIGAVAIFAVLFWPLLKARPQARFWATGMVISILPVCATAPGERLLCFPGLGAMALVAMFIEQAVATWRLPQHSWRRRIDKPAVCFLVAAHLVIAPIAMPFSSISVSVFGNSMKRAWIKLPADPSIAEKSLVILRAPVDVFVPELYDFRMANNQPAPRHTWALTVGTAAVNITCVDTNTIDVWQDGGFFAYPYGTTYRGPRRPFKAGETIATEGFTATVLSVTPDNRPQEIQFRFNTPLNDTSLLWYQVAPGGVSPVHPLKPGDRLDLPAQHAMDLLMP